MATTTCIRPGLHRINGITCRCGGELLVDRCGNRGEFLWETYCSQCWSCDCNGHQTLGLCVDNAEGYFNPQQQKEGHPHG